MKYIKVLWIHNLEDKPCIFFHEIDGNGFEIRKVELQCEFSFLAVPINVVSLFKCRNGESNKIHAFSKWSWLAYLDMYLRELATY